MNHIIVRAAALCLSITNLPTASTFLIQPNITPLPSYTTFSFTITPSPTTTTNTGTHHTSISTHRFLTTTPDDEERHLQQQLEKTWRHAKKPLLRIGSKGITSKHGNSLLQLLNDHTVVKIKINTTKMGTLEEAAGLLIRAVDAVETESGSGSNGGVELIQVREIENTVLLGKGGVMDEIREGSFPPEVVVWGTKEEYLAKKEREKEE